ncbi:MAG: hypothetical protein KAQ74_03810 [Dehalococcoidia bacterium]|nr:hypothetical protein [Dehalococcoidia bacterium]
MLAKNDRPEGGWLVKCDGCGNEILAELFPDKLVVIDKRHGQKHVAVISRCEILQIMGACLEGLAVRKECTSDSNGAAMPLQQQPLTPQIA